MHTPDVVLLLSDSEVAKSLVSALSGTFRSVHQVHSVADLRNSLAKQPARIAILDMEFVSLPDLEHLAHEFPDAGIVCTHRCADEEMWAAALNAGAADVCPANDIPGIVRAAGNSGMHRSAAA